MEILKHPLIISLVILCFTYWYLKNKFTKNSSVPINWPLIGMFPGIIQNVHRIHDYFTSILLENGGNFEFRGPIFTNMNMLFTSDPANIHHILSRNFSNYPKGPEFRKMFDILGNGIFRVDSELWEIHRKMTMSLLNHPKFQILLEHNVWETIVKRLVPLVDTFSKQGNPVDLQDIIQRLNFDTISKLLFDHDPKSLSVNLPHVPCEKAFNDMVDAILYRHFLPEIYWKLQRWLRIGKEKNLMNAWEAFDQFIYPAILRKQEKMMNNEDDDFDFFTDYVKSYHQWEKENNLGNVQDFLKDTFLNLMFAGRDTVSTTLTWFFWLVAKNPFAVKKIREEIQQQLHLKEGEDLRFFNTQESRKLVYLHGAFCESLRLFPPVAIEHKAPVDHDILPSGHRVSPNKKILLSFITMGRMETLWGKDCLEFKPERWITERGGIKHEPSYKFPAFLAGPRTCVGKEMAFIQMKMIAANIIYNYDIQLVEPQTISPTATVVIRMTNGLKVRLVKRVHLCVNNYS